MYHPEKSSYFSTRQVTHYNVTNWAGNPLQYTILYWPVTHYNIPSYTGQVTHYNVTIWATREILRVSFIIGQVAQNNLIHFKQKKKQKTKNKKQKTKNKKKWVVFQITCSLCKSHMSIYCFRSFQDSKKKFLFVSTFLYKFTTQS